MPVDPDCDDGDCGDEPPDPEPGCGDQGCQSPNVYKYILSQPGGPGTCVVCGQTAQCVAPDYPNSYDTLDLCCDVANDSNEQIDPPCPPCVAPECVSTSEFTDITSTVYPPGTSCGAFSGWITWNPTVYGCQWYRYIECPPGCLNTALPTPTGTYLEGGACCDPATGYTGCEQGIDWPCLCPDGSTPAVALKPVLKDKPCATEECEGKYATWIGQPTGEANSDGEYAVEWFMVDDCPGPCCTEPPKTPILIKETIIVDTPCKCECE